MSPRRPGLAEIAWSYSKASHCNAIALYIKDSAGFRWAGRVGLAEFPEKIYSVYDSPLDHHTSKVVYGDGSTHVFSTLERPKVFVDPRTNWFAHLFNAAFDPSECAPTACASCKWNGTFGKLRPDQTGNASTIVRRLDWGGVLP